MHSACSVATPQPVIAAVADRYRALLERYAEDPLHLQMLHALSAEGNVLAKATVGETTMAVHLPLCIHDYVGGGDASVGIELAAILALLETGIYALDHLMENELGPAARAFPRGAVLTTAIGLLSHLPQRALLGWLSDANLPLTLFEVTLLRLAAIGHGQALESFHGFADPPDPAQVERSLLGKTGARRGLYAQLAALAGGAAQAQAGDFYRFAESLGAARQIHSDIHDLYGGPGSRDIPAGVCTLPLAFYFQIVHAQEGKAMRAVLQAVGQGNEGLTEVRRRLTASGALREALARKEFYCARAQHYLARACLHDTPPTLLAGCIDAISWSHANG